MNRSKGGMVSSRVLLFLNSGASIELFLLVVNHFRLIDGA